MASNSSDLAIERMRAAGLDVRVDADSLFWHSLDQSRFSVKPAAVVAAGCADDVGAVLKIANECEVGLTVRGRGTGCCGGAVPIDGSIVLDVSGINFIEIDPVSRVAHVGAGAVNADIDAAARKHGLFYAPDPSSNKYCSIGGNIACNAGGLHALKYGLTRENVLALSAYTGAGDFLKCALPLKKYSVGLNLRDFFIGSEGTLGVITEAWLKLLPVPPRLGTIAAFFDTDFDAFDGAAELMKSGLNPCVLEFMDALTVSCVRRKAPDLPIPEGKACLLMEFDGCLEDVESSLSRARAMFKDARAASEERRREVLWNIRRWASSAMYLLADSKVNQDVVIAQGALKEFMAFYKDLGRRVGLPTPTFGHCGDDNYHIHFMYNSSDPGAKSRARGAMAESIAKAIELGGAVSGEHGIGFLKTKYMKLQHSPYELELMRQIKRLFDPKMILNNGKVFYDSNCADGLEPLKGVKLPWD